MAYGSCCSIRDGTSAPTECDGSYRRILGCDPGHASHRRVAHAHGGDDDHGGDSRNGDADLVSYPCLMIDAVGYESHHCAFETSQPSSRWRYLIFGAQTAVSGEDMKTEASRLMETLAAKLSD